MSMAWAATPRARSPSTSGPREAAAPPAPRGQGVRGGGRAGRPAPPTPPRLTARARAWLARWRPVMPILVAEFVVVVGFGALLPVLPLYVVDPGVDPATLGIILAAWPAARPLFH